MTMVQQPFDRERVPAACFADLDLALVSQAMQQGSGAGRYAGPLDPRAYLVRHGGAVADGEQLHPTVAGVLAFTQEPDRWLTASGIDIALYRAEQLSPTQARVRQVRGSIFAVIDTAYAILKEACTISRQEDARVVDDLDTPGIVLRELTTNAVVHRDLNVYGSVVRINVFPRYIEWSSPGGLPANITIETLLTAQFSRNPSLAQFLFHAGYIEKFGMGLDVVSDTLRRASSAPPSSTTTATPSACGSTATQPRPARASLRARASTPSWRSSPSARSGASASCSTGWASRAARCSATSTCWSARASWSPAARPGVASMASPPTAQPSCSPGCFASICLNLPQ